MALVSQVEISFFNEMAKPPHHHTCGESLDRLQEALEILRHNSLRITQPRKAILEVLFQQDAPAPIEEIHRGLEPGLCDLATVYRCLAAFEKLDLVRRCHFHDGTSLYEINLGPDHHHHIVCTSCHKVEALDFCVVEGLERLVRDRGYTHVSHMLEFFGVCSECSRHPEAQAHD
jgi:Fur family transcriptional regulator, ferric uptake regulator